LLGGGGGDGGGFGCDLSAPAGRKIFGLAGAPGPAGVFLGFPIFLQEEKGKISGEGAAKRADLSGGGNGFGGGGGKFVPASFFPPPGAIAKGAREKKKFVELILRWGGGGGNLKRGGRFSFRFWGFRDDLMVGSDVAARGFLYGFTPFAVAAL